MPMKSILSQRPISSNTAIADALHFQISPAAHTLPGFRDWVQKLPENVKVALVGGEVFIDTSNEDIERHVSVKGVIFATLFHIMAS